MKSIYMYPVAVFPKPSEFWKETVFIPLQDGIVKLPVRDCILENVKSLAITVFRPWRTIFYRGIMLPASCGAGDGNRNILFIHSVTFQIEQIPDFLKEHQKSRVKIPRRQG